MNGYQLSKARKIAGVILAAHTNNSRYELAKLVALADADTWRKLSFAAGVPVADLDAKAAVVAILRQKGIHRA